MEMVIIFRKIKKIEIISRLVVIQRLSNEKTLEKHDDIIMVFRATTVEYIHNRKLRRKNYPETTNIGCIIVLVIKGYIIFLVYVSFHKNIHCIFYSNILFCLVFNKSTSCNNIMSCFL